MFATTGATLAAKAATTLAAIFSTTTAAATDRANVQQHLLQ